LSADRTEAIAFRTLGPLPSLDSVVFIRKASRDFVLGRGAFPTQHSARVRAFFRISTAVLAIVGTALTLAALGYAVASGLPFSEMNGFFLFAGPVLLLSAAIYYLFNLFIRRRANIEKQLIERGGLLAGELVSTKFRSDENGGTTLRVECRFTSPSAMNLTGKRHFNRYDVDRKAPPPPGTKLLIVYVDDKVWEVL
jgi:hypothetical protein